DVAGERGQRTDHDAAALAGEELRQPGLGVIDRAENAARLLHQELAGRREAHLVVDEADELAAERALHLADLLRDRRLAHLKLLRGTRQRAGMRNGPKNLELP